MSADLNDDFGAPVAAHGVTVKDFEVEDNVYQVGLPPRRIDLLTSISGVAFDEANARRVTVEIDGRTIPFIGREALVRNKRATGREKDRLDADLLDRATIL